MPRGSRPHLAKAITTVHAHNTRDRIGVWNEGRALPEAKPGLYYGTFSSWDLEKSLESDVAVNAAIDNLL
jgi:hypothetical protein